MKKIINEDLDKKDLEDMKHIFIQDDDEILDIPSMINKVHTEKIDRDEILKVAISQNKPLKDIWRTFPPKNA